MSNSIPGSVPVSIEIPTYVADGYVGSGDTRELTFSGGAPATDGTGPCLAFIKLSISGLSYEAGDFGSPLQRLVCYSNTSVGRAKVTGGSGFTFVLVGNYSFLAFSDMTD